jgi:hypothetical protein
MKFTSTLKKILSANWQGAYIAPASQPRQLKNVKHGKVHTLPGAPQFALFAVFSVLEIRRFIMVKQLSGAFMLGIAVLAPAVYADEFGDATQALCEKVKSCAVAQMAGQDIPPETRQMMQPMLDSMCTQINAKVGEVPTGHPLYKPAVACMESMNSLTCEEMQDAAGMATPECEEYEELAREAGE